MSDSSREVDVTISPFEQGGLAWFVATGAPRSGTTMLARLLNTHPEIGCLNEVLLSDFLAHLQPFFAEQNVRIAIAQSNERNFSRFRQDADTPGHRQLEPESRQTRAERVGALRDATLGNFGFGTGPGTWELWQHAALSARTMVGVVLGKDGLTCIGTKHPNLDLLETWVKLETLLPNLRLVHIVRRPRDVVNSSLARRNKATLGTDVWHINTVEEASKEWMSDWNRALQARAILGNRLLELRYEDLVGQDSRVADDLAAHLGVENQFDLSVCQPLAEDLHGYALTEAEDKAITAIFGEMDAAWEIPIDELRTRFGRIAFPLPASGKVRFGLSGNGHFYVGDGFSIPEHWGQWTDSERAYLDLRLSSGSGDLLLTLRFQLWQAQPDRPFECLLSADGWRTLISIERATTGEVIQRSFLVPRAALRYSSRLHLELTILTPKFETDEPMEEKRRLGLGLHDLRVQIVEDTADGAVRLTPAGSPSWQ